MPNHKFHVKKGCLGPPSDREMFIIMPVVLGTGAAKRRASTKTPLIYWVIEIRSLD
jgi:hypothetical protein